MKTAFLHSVIEAPKEQSIRCQTPGCTASVWKAIHVVVMDGDIQLYGSSCFKKVFEGTSMGASSPTYGVRTGRLLTDGERLMLLENRRRLLDLLEEQHREEIDRLAKLQALENQKRDQDEQEFERLLFSRNEATKLSPQVKPNAETKAQVLAEAKNRVREEFGVNPDLAGWVGLVKSYEAKILKELGYS